MTELVEAGASGWMIPAGVRDELAAAVTDAARAPTAPLAEMGRRGAACVAARHDAGVEARKLLRLFDGAGQAAKQAA